MSVHSKFAPSAMARIIACPASIRESSYVPVQPPSQYALAGTEQHELFTRLWDGEIDEDDLGEYKYNVLSCVDYLGHLTTDFPDGDLKLETRVDLKDWGMDEIFGTADVIYDTPDVLHVIDWKFGQGVQVFAENNKQALTYAAGVAGFPPIKDKIVIHIVQPPLDHYDQWEISSAYLRDFVFEELEPAITEAKTNHPRYQPGKEQCRFCPAAMKCRARLEFIQHEAGAIFREHSKLKSVSMEEIGEMLEKAKVLKDYLKQLDKYALSQLEQGVKIPGWKLVTGRSVRKWVDEDEAAKWLGDRISPLELYKSKMLSPAQVEKLNRKYKKDKDFQKLVHKPQGKPQLATADDKRAEYTNGSAAVKFAAFMKNEGEL